MTDETFVNQNDVEGTASGVWSRMLAGNRRFAEGKLGASEPQCGSARGGYRHA